MDNCGSAVFNLYELNGDIFQPNQVWRTPISDASGNVGTTEIGDSHLISS